MQSRAGRAVGLSLVWIVTILPAIERFVLGPHRGLPDDFGFIFVGRPDWRSVLLQCAHGLGAAYAWLGAMAWAWWIGAYDLKIGLWRPWKVESWILDVTRFGGVFGSILVAALPTWVIWWWSRVTPRTASPPRTPPSLGAALRAVATTAVERPSAWVFLAALDLVASHAGYAGSVPSPARFLVWAALTSVVGLASVRVALAATDGREWDLGDVLGNPARILAYGVTTSVVSLGVVVGLLLGVVPGVVVGVIFGFAPFVVAAEGGSPTRALARSAALTRGVRWALVRIGVALVGLQVGLVALLARWTTSGAMPTGLMVVSEVVLVPLAAIASAHLYRRLIASLPTQGEQPASRPGWRHDPALSVAVAWTIALVVPLGWRIVERVRHPNPTWLMLPPLREARADLTVPIQSWCHYSWHASASGCQWTLARTGKGVMLDGYAFDGAQCFPVERVGFPSPHDDIVGHLGGVLRRAVASGGVVQRSWRIGSDTFDYVILARDEEGTAFPIVAIDVGGRDIEDVDQARLGRLAAAGLPEYWRVSEPYGGMPAMVTVWSEPNRRVPGYMRSRGWSGSGHDPESKPIRLGDTRLDANDFVPPACPPRLEVARPPAPSPAPRPVCDGTLTFVLDGANPSASVELAASGVAHFRGVSSAPPRFDPRRFALQVTMRGRTYPSPEILDASLQSGARWRTATSGTAWTYDDPGRADGITHVVLTRTGPERDRLAWEIEVRAPVSPPAVFDWQAVVVTMRLQDVPDAPGACGSVFIPVQSSSGGCVLDPTTRGVRCTVSSATPECTASDMDGILRCAIDETARAQDTYYARSGAYFTGGCDNLAGVPDRTGIVCTTAGMAASFVVTAIYAGAGSACTLSSAAGPLIQCDGGTAAHPSAGK
jgi:hypothetical protein